jgi:hypothetical protein
MRVKGLLILAFKVTSGKNTQTLIDVSLFSFCSSSTLTRLMGLQWYKYGFLKNLKCTFDLKTQV